MSGDVSRARPAPMDASPRCKACGQPIAGPVAAPHWPRCETCGRPHVPPLTDRQWETLSAAMKAPVEIGDKHAKRVARNLSDLTLCQIMWPGPRLVIAPLGRERVRLGREGKGAA